MRILLAVHCGLNDNSGRHVAAFARHLGQSGHSVTVAVPGDTTGDARSEPAFALTTLARVGRRSRWPAPDIVHLWTPRERLFRMWKAVRGRRAWAASRLFVHLEDNERHLSEVFSGRSWGDLAADSRWPRTAGRSSVLSVPRHVDDLLSAASGVTCIIEALRRDVPATTPSMVLWPGVDLDVFHPTTVPASSALRDRLGIAADQFVICYPGTVHAANAGEVRQLYEAVALLNEQGRSTTLVRTGTDRAPFLGPDPSWAEPFTVTLGVIGRSELARLLAMADALVQPGTPGPFNDLRLPAKVPEFLASGRPVVLPRTNVGLELTDGEEAIVVDVADARGIAAAVGRLQDDRVLARRVAAGGRAFAEARLGWADQAARLAGFYAEPAGVDPLGLRPP